MRFISATIFAILLLAGLSFSVSVISQCTNISYPGDYQLNQNLVGATFVSPQIVLPACILINSSNVSLDCAGFNITDNSTSASYAIAENVSAIHATNITIANCDIINFTNATNGGSGVYLNNAEFSLVTNNTFQHDSIGVLDYYLSLSNNFTKNIFNDSGFTQAQSEISSEASFDIIDNNIVDNYPCCTGALLISGYGINITNNRGFNNSLMIYLSGAPFAAVINNTAYQDSPYALLLFISHGDLIADNNFTNDYIGIYSEAGSYNNTFINNTLSSNKNTGIKIQNSNTTYVYNDHLFNNSVDLAVSSSAGDMLLTLDGAILDNPTGNYANYTNLSLVTVVRNNTAFSMNWTANPAALPTNFISFAGKFVNITNQTPNVSIDSITWNWLPSETSGYFPPGFQLWDYRGSSWALSNSTPDTVNDRLSLTNLSSFSTFAILQNTSYVTNCTNITTPGAYQLAQNLIGGNNSNPGISPACINIFTSNVTFDCNGFNLTDNGIAQSAFYVGNPVTNVEIKNCVASGYPVGVYAIYASNSIFENNTILNSGNTGLFLTEDNNGLVDSNKVFNGGRGIFLFGVGDTLSNNVVCNDQQGFRLTGFYSPGDLVSFSGNTVCNNTNEGLYASLSSGPLAISSKGDHFYGNNPDVGIYANASVNLSNDIFDNPLGNYQNMTNLSLSDNQNDSYRITYSAQPAALPSGQFSFAGKFVNITNLTTGVSIGSVVWSWLPGELVAPYMSSKFQLWDYNGSIWRVVNSTPDTVGNVLSLANLSSFSTFAILQQNVTAPPPSSGGGTSGTSAYLVLSEQSVCPVNGANITVTSSSSGKPVSGATVTVGTYTGTTGSDGTVLLTMTSSGFFTMSATATGYSQGTGGFGFNLCSAPVAQPQCTVDQNCSDSQTCSSGMCIPVSCPSGQVIDHQCQMNQTQNTTQSCNAPSCCVTDSACADNQQCLAPAGAAPSTNQFGSCVNITGCGAIGFHALVPYQCGDNCPACPSGSICQDHVCALSGLDCPSTAMLNDTKTCIATTNGQAFSNCDYTITDPNGVTTIGQCDESGNLQTPPLTISGQWTITLMENGTALKASQIVVKSPPASNPSPAPAATSGFDIMPFVWLLIILIIIAGVVLYFRRSKK